MVDLIVHSPSLAVPKRVVSATERLLESVPESLLVGLRKVVITTSLDVSAKARRFIFNRKGTALGAYWRRERGAPARIEIYLDTVGGRWHPSSLRLPLLADFAVGSILYHEIGHHVNFHVRPEHMDRELAADEWRDRLLKEYLKQHFSWAKWPIRLLLPILRCLRWLQRGRR